jgi:hypothetical protein
VGEGEAAGGGRRSLRVGPGRQRERGGEREGDMGWLGRIFLTGCCSYLEDKVGLALPIPLFLGRLEGVGTVGGNLHRQGFQRCATSTLQHLAALMIMTPLVNEHLSMIRAESNGHSDNWIKTEHNCRLTAWLNHLDLLDGETVDEQTIKRLAVGLSSQVTSWQGYDINVYLFYTTAKNKKTVSQWYSY